MAGQLYGFAAALGIEVNATAMQERFEQLYEQHGAAVHAYLLRRSRTSWQAEDLLNDVFTVVWQKVADLPTPEQCRPWLFGIARNVLLTSQRQETRKHQTMLRLASELKIADSFDASVDTDRFEFVRSALQMLPESDRELLMLASWEKLSASEIAGAMNLSPGAVRVRLHRARRRLKCLLEEESNSSGERAECTSHRWPVHTSVRGSML